MGLKKVSHVRTNQRKRPDFYLSPFSPWLDRIVYALATFLPATFAVFSALSLVDFSVVFSSHTSTFSLILKGFNIGKYCFTKIITPTIYLDKNAGFRICSSVFWANRSFLWAKERKSYLFVKKIESLSSLNCQEWREQIPHDCSFVKQTGVIHSLLLFFIEWRERIAHVAL